MGENGQNMSNSDDLRVGKIEFRPNQSDFVEISPKPSKIASFGAKITNFLEFKDQIDRITLALERIATVLERGVPPAQVQEPLPRLTEKDYARATNETTFEQEVLDAALKMNPDLSTDQAAMERVREFIHSRSQL